MKTVFTPGPDRFHPILPENRPAGCACARRPAPFPVLLWKGLKRFFTQTNICVFNMGFTML